MNFFQHPGCNHKFAPPPGVTEEQCGTLPVFSSHDPEFGPAFTSFWKPDEVELALLAGGGAVALTIYGGGHPVVSVGTAPKVE